MNITSASYFKAGDGTRIAYRIDGMGGIDGTDAASAKPVLVLSNSIGTSMRIWDLQIRRLSEHFSVLRFDTRGHGASDVPTGAYSLDRLGRDVIELLDSLDIEKAHFLGLSLGGFTGQWLGIHAPERINRLILSNTASYLGPAAQWDERIAAVLQARDMGETAAMFLANWFPAQMIEAKAPVVDDFRAMLLATSAQGLAGSYAAVRDTDLRKTIALIDRPTLVIGGQYDTVTLARHSEAIAATIPGARLMLLPSVHLSNIEFPEEFVQTVIDFLLAE